MPDPPYLRPYLDATAKHGAGFDSLLWANPAAQAARFAAIARWAEIENRTVLDAGCGRADLLDYLLNQRIRPSRYIGIEAVEPLAEVAQQKVLAQKLLSNATIQRGDFLANPELLNQHADVIIFSGSLNTLTPDEFHSSLRIGWEYTRSELAFNFLCSPRLASGDHLNWYPIGELKRFAESLTSDVAVDDSYRDGDCTIVMRKTDIGH
jgi:hypothetical protein